MTANPGDRIRAQLALVEEHVRRENAHDLPGIMATFGQRARYDDEPWGEHHEGRDAVRGLYTFDEDGKLAGERIYYDRGSRLRQVGLYHDPQSLLGRLETLLAHPVTVARAYARQLTGPAA